MYTVKHMNTCCPPEHDRAQRRQKRGDFCRRLRRRPAWVWPSPSGVRRITFLATRLSRRVTTARPGSRRAEGQRAVTAGGRLWRDGARLAVVDEYSQRLAGGAILMDSEFQERHAHCTTNR